MIKRNFVTGFLAASALVVTMACGALPFSLGSNGSAQGASPQQAPQAAQQVQQTSNTQANTPVQISGPLAAYEQTLVSVYQNVIPSVVHIRTDTGSGSGFVWDTDGNIVTNNHVIDGANQIQVAFADGATYPATVVGTDVNADLAVVRVNATGTTLKPIQVADSTQVQVGEIAIAIGGPFGLDGSMSLGIISGLGRDLAVDSASSSGSYTIPDIIQTDAPINPGNSGGVLVDDSGKLIGVTAAIASPVRASSGVGFVIPSVIVSKVVPALIRDGHYDHTWLGISGGTLTSEAAAQLGLNASQHGAVVMDVLQGGPAGKAGLKSGDVIVSVDNQPVARFNDLTIYLARSTDVGQTINLGVLRGGQQVSVALTLEARPTQ